MKSFATIVTFGVVMLIGAPRVEAQECEPQEQQVEEWEHQIRDLQQQIGQLNQQLAQWVGDNRQDETRSTVARHKFTRVAPPHPDFGESWQDPDGTTWGDVIKKEDGSIHLMDHNQATEYCQSRDAQLPSYEDFIRLRGYMGAEPAPKFGALAVDALADSALREVLPNLTRGNYYYWSSKIVEDDTDRAYLFGVRKGGMHRAYRVGYQRHAGYAVRCVVRRF